MVPQKHIRWVSELPSNVASTIAGQFDRFGVDLIMSDHDSNGAANRIFLDTIRNKLTRNLAKLQPAVAEELSRNMYRALGTDTERWVEANVCDTVEKTITSAILRVTVGESMCRNEEFQQELTRNYTALAYHFVLIGYLIPSFLRPTIGWLVSRYTVLTHMRLVNKWLIPMVSQRFENLIKKRQDAGFSPPQDLVTWALDSLLASKNGEHLGPYDMAYRLPFVVGH